MFESLISEIINIEFKMIQSNHHSSTILNGFFIVSNDERR